MMSYDIVRARSSSAKTLVRDFVEAVWLRREIARLSEFWTADCVNHAPGGGTGLEALAMYHAYLFSLYDAFADVRIDVVQQVEEAGRVVTHMQSAARHTGDFAGIAATGRAITMATIRIDRITDGRICEHWAVADMAGLMQQLQG